MNWHGGWALIKSTWMSWMQDKAFFFLLAFGCMIPPLVSLFVWYTAAEGKVVGGLTQGEFVAYYLLLILINQLTYSQTNWTVGDGIRDGRISVILLRPMSPLFNTIAAEVAGKVVFMTFVIPVSFVLALILHPELHPTLIESLLFFPSLVLAWLLRFFWGYWLALLAFWLTRATALLAVQDSLIFLLAGQVAPVALLPGPLHMLAQLLPFRYMLGFPIEVLTGHLSTSELLIGFVYQLGWLVTAITLFLILWRQGVRRYSAVGG